MTAADLAPVPLSGTPELPKASGAFFTSVDVYRFMAACALPAPNDRVLEPSCGGAAFLVAAVQRPRELHVDPVVDGSEITSKARGPSPDCSRIPVAEKLDRALAYALSAWHSKAMYANRHAKLTTGLNHNGPHPTHPFESAATKYRNVPMGGEVHAIVDGAPKAGNCPNWLLDSQLLE